MFALKMNGPRLLRRQIARKSLRREKKDLGAILGLLGGGFLLSSFAYGAYSLTEEAVEAILNWLAGEEETLRMRKYELESELEEINEKLALIEQAKIEAADAPTDSV